MKGKITLSIIKAICGGLIVYLFHGSMEKKLLWIGYVFKDGVEAWLLTNAFGTILILFGIIIICDIIISFGFETDKKRKVQDNICRDIFERFITANGFVA